jgi:uncharacterized membrane protein
MALVVRLREQGLRLKPAGQNLIVEPRSALTDALRELIKRNKPEILRELADEARRSHRAIAAARDAAPLADFRAALVTGRLYLCCNCAQFAFTADPAALGRCHRFSVEAAPFIPFWCVGFEPSLRPVAPDYLPNAKEFHT